MHTIAFRLLTIASPGIGVQGLSDDERAALVAAAHIIDDLWKAESNDLHERLNRYTLAAARGIVSLAEARKMYEQ